MMHQTTWNQPTIPSTASSPYHCYKQNIRQTQSTAIHIIFMSTNLNISWPNYGKTFWSQENPQGCIALSSQ